MKIKSFFSNFDLSIQKGAHLALALFIFVTALYFLQFNPIDLPTLANWTIVAILLFSSGYLHTLDVLLSIEDLLQDKIDNVNENLRMVRQDFNSTVRTLTFMYNSDGVSKVKVPENSLKKVEEVVDGNVRMKTVPNFLNSNSTVIMMEGVESSKLKNHSHQEKVYYFLANGEVVVTEEGKAGRILRRGDRLEVEPNEKREIIFKKNSVLIALYDPALENKKMR